MKYEITAQELTCINILIRVLQEAINRNVYTESEIDNILFTLDQLNKRQNKNKLITNN